jgi:hypothetical protein
MIEFCMLSDSCICLGRCVYSQLRPARHKNVLAQRESLTLRSVRDFQLFLLSCDGSECMRPNITCSAPMRKKTQKERGAWRLTRAFFLPSFLSGGPLNIVSFLLLAVRNPEIMRRYWIGFYALPFRGAIFLLMDSSLSSAGYLTQFQ